MNRNGFILWILLTLIFLMAREGQAQTPEGKGGLAEGNNGFETAPVASPPRSLKKDALSIFTRAPSIAYFAQDEWRWSLERHWVEDKSTRHTSQDFDCFSFSPTPATVHARRHPVDRWSIIAFGNASARHSSAPGSHRKPVGNLAAPNRHANGARGTRRDISRRPA